MYVTESRNRLDYYTVNYLVNMGGLIRDFHFLLYILFICSQHIYILY